MAPNQKDYRDRVEQWSSRHVQTLWPMSRAVLWPDAVLDGARGPVVALYPDRQRAIEELKLIIAKPAMFRAMGNMPVYPAEPQVAPSIHDHSLDVLFHAAPAPSALIPRVPATPETSSEDT